MRTTKTLVSVRLDPDVLAQIDRLITSRSNLDGLARRHSIPVPRTRSQAIRYALHLLVSDNHPC